MWGRSDLVDIYLEISQMFHFVSKNPTASENSGYNCDACGFITGNKKDFIRHEKTLKHGRNVSLLFQKTPDHIQIDHQTVSLRHACIKCSGVFSSRVTLWRHKKKCEKSQPLDTPCDHIDSSAENTVLIQDFLSEVAKQNNHQNVAFIEQFTEKFMEKFMEMSTAPSLTITNNTTNNNTVNNQFNLNVFLNEKCKNALNMVEFIDSLEVQVSDLVHTGKVGFVEGITTILLNKMGELDVYQRPLHCTDAKREVVYIKNENAWEKENDDKSRVRCMVNRIAKKNLDQIVKWAEENPDFMVLDSKAYNEYIQIGLHSTGGTVEQQEKNIDKVVTNILKAVVIDKKKESTALV